MKRLASVIGLCLGLAFAAVLVSAGNARADYQAGLAAFDAGDYAKAAEEWQAAANTGDARAEHGLGLLYDLGKGVPADPQQAAKWYTLAAAQGLPADESNLALMYAQGRGVDKDLVKAAQLWTDSGKAGYSTAQFNLALMYYRGDGVAKSYATAAAWFRKAAESGSVDGQYALGEIYRLGRGVNKDLSKARFWFAMAAKNGNIAALDRLNEMPPGNVASALAATGAGTAASATAAAGTTAAATGNSTAAATAILTPATKVTSTSTVSSSTTADQSGASRAKRWFLQNDRNHDGYLTADEVIAYQLKLLKRMDQFNDGNISPQEYCQGDDPDMAAYIARCHRQFATIDSNGDGYITAQEVTEYYQLLLQTADLHKDGKITLDEWLAVAGDDF